MQWTTLFKKEMMENWRNKKWVWVPLVIILIAIMDPISNYYLPQIMEMGGGLPEGATLEVPEFSPDEVVAMSLGQLSSLGVLVIVLMSMGTIAGERKSGVSELILVKPVSYKNYITAKWAANLFLVWGALIAGMATSWYYINILFGELSFLALLKIILFYGLWFTLVITLCVFFNTLFKTAGLVAFMTIISLMLMSIITKIFGRGLAWSPSNLSKYIQEMLVTGTIPSDIVAATAVTIGIIAVLLVGSVLTFRTKELA